jgi:hypothetical protein
MRAGSALLLLLLCSCAARKPATPGEIVEERDGGAPRLLQASDAGTAAVDAGVASENWLPAPADGPSFQARLARESTALKSYEFSSPGGRYSGSVLAVSKPHVEPAKEKQVAVLVVPIGASHPIRCALQDGEMHPAQRLRVMLENLSKRRAVVGLAVVEVKAVSAAPLLTLDVLSAPLAPAPESLPAALDAGPSDLDAGSDAGIVAPVAPPEPAYDEVKIAFLSRAQASLICTHDGVGDRRTFERVVESAAGSVLDSTAAKRVGPRSALLQVIRSEGKLVGYRHQRSFPPKADGSHIELLSAPRFDRSEDGKLLESDVEVTEKRALNGELRAGDYAVTQSGEVTKLTLDEEPDSGYAVHGTVAGKPLEQSIGTIKGAKGLRRPTAEQLAEVASGAKAELVFDDYSPLQPLQLILARVQRGSAPNQLVVKSSAGEDQRWTVDESGRLLKIEQRGPQGAPETVERIWAWGGL